MQLTHVTTIAFKLRYVSGVSALEYVAKLAKLLVQALERNHNGRVSGYLDPERRDNC